MSITFKQFAKKNRRRSESPNGFNHKLNAWSASEWFVAIAGEVGEAANIVKKLNRYRDNIPGNEKTIEELRQQLANELADIFTYLDLTAQYLGMDLEEVTLKKFDEVSKRINYDD